MGHSGGCRRRRWPWDNEGFKRGQRLLVPPWPKTSVAPLVQAVAGFSSADV